MTILPSESQRKDSGDHFREVLPIRPRSVAAGAIAATLWFVAILLLGLSRPLLIVAMVLSFLTACLIAWILLYKGDRGVAVGISVITAVWISITVRSIVHIWLGW